MILPFAMPPHTPTALRRDMYQVLDRVIWQARNEMVNFDWKTVLVGVHNQHGIEQAVLRDAYIGWVDQMTQDEAVANPREFAHKHKAAASKETVNEYVHMVKKYFEAEKRNTTWMTDVYCKISSDKSGMHRWNTFYMCDKNTMKKTIIAIDGLGIDMVFALPLELSAGRFYLVQEVEVLYERGLITKAARDRYMQEWIQDPHNEGKIEWEQVYEAVA